MSHDALKRIDPSIEGAYRRSRLCGDEILVNCVGTIGLVAMVMPAEAGFNIARAVARIRLSPTVDREFIAEQLRTPSIQRYFTQELRTVSQPTLNIKQLAETQVLLPPPEMQATFKERMSAFKQVKSAHRKGFSEMDALFTSLQHRAFRENSEAGCLTTRSWIEEKPMGYAELLLILKQLPEKSRRRCWISPSFWRNGLPARAATSPTLATSSLARWIQAPVGIASFASEPL